MTRKWIPSLGKRRDARDRVRFRDKDPVRMGIIGVVVLVLLMALALQYQNLPLIKSDRTYKAHFSDAAGLKTGDLVKVSGLKAGKVEGIELDGDKVLVTFTVTKDVHLGSRTRVDISTDSLLGKRALRVVPDGPGGLEEDVIPLDRTNEPYALTDALGDLTDVARDLDTQKVNQALDTLSTTFREIDPSLKPALDGVSRLSKTLNERDEQLRELLKHANSVSGVLGARSEQMNRLLLDADTLMASLDRRKSAIDDLISNISLVSTQLTGLVKDNESELEPALEKLNSVLEVLQRNSDALTQGLEQIGPYSTALGEAVASGPFFYAYVQNLSLPHYTQGLSDMLVHALGGPAPLPRENNPNMPQKPDIKFQKERPDFGERAQR